MKRTLLLSFFFFVISQQVLAQTHYFYGYTSEFYTETTNWGGGNYPGEVIDAAEYARISSNYSLGKCSLDVNVVNNGRMLLQSKFYYNGHTVTNNGIVNVTGTLYGNAENAAGTWTPGWDPFFEAWTNTYYGTFTNNGVLIMDFDGDDGSNDQINATGGSTLGGTLEIQFENNFVPNLNSPYTLIFGGPVSGTFSTVIWPSGATGTINYSASSVSATVTNYLPVELTDFTVRQDDQQALLQWETASEINNSHFNVQHATDGHSFQNIGRIKGAGSTLEPQRYEFVHTELQEGTNYYRLQQMDFDGGFEYSPVITLDLKSENGLRVYPNPVDEELNLSFREALRGAARLKISDLSGRCMLSRELNGKDHDFTIDLIGIPGNIYLLEVIDDRTHYQELIVKLSR